jgi:hypothetical protein
LLIENRGCKRDRIDATLRYLDPDVGNVGVPRCTRGNKRCRAAIVAPYQRGLRRRHNHTLTIRNRDPQIDRGIFRLHPSQIFGEVCRIGSLSRKGSSHHENIALALVQHPVELLSHFRRGQREFSSRCLHETSFDEPCQDDPGKERAYSDGDQEIGQPPITAKIEEC